MHCTRLSVELAQSKTRIYQRWFMDPTILSFQNHLLRKSDVDLLEDGNWINDNIIGFMFE